MRMSSKSKSPKTSLLDYFKPKPTGGKSKKKDEDNNEVEEVEEQEVVELEQAEAVEVDGEAESEVQEVEVEPPEEPSPPPEEVDNGRRRSTRASATRARTAWNGGPPSDSSSEEEDDDLPRSTRKRKKTRASIQNSSKRNKQTTLSNDGKIINKKDKENKNNTKKKARLDPEREAFLRSGVPDVIEKAKARVKASKNSVITLDDDDDVEEVGPEKEKRKPLDPATLAFLHSGLPESIKKAKESVNKRREENESLTNMGFFPKISHTSIKQDEEDDTPSTSEAEAVSKFPLKNLMSQDESQENGCVPSGLPSVENLELLFTSTNASCLSSQENALFQPVGICCDDNAVQVSSQEDNEPMTRYRRDNSDKNADKDYRPWIAAMKVKNVKELVVDPNGMETLTKWLKQWRSDIKDDGGTSRKLQKKKRDNSDSDFITSDEEESEIKKKSVLLTGPSGCGKTAAVYVLAKHYGFEVVEVNFSSRRPGKDVLQRVEEAVLSHRLKSSHNCLLLFKDIDLFHPEEDEGFFSAVAQLITTAVRPIVMTSSLPAYYLIDSRLDKKDPLRISFTFPKPRDIVEKILKPIIVSTKSNVESDNPSGNVDLWLDSIVRHSGCDIRQCINQLQLLLSTSTSSLKPKCLSNNDIHLYSSPFLPHSVDLNFPRQGLVLESSSQNGSSSQEEDEVNLSLSARKKLCQSQLEKLGETLELFADLDWISSTNTSFSTLNTNVFGDIDEAKWRWNHVSEFRSPFFTRLSMVLEDSKKTSKENLKWTRQLVLETDDEIDKWVGIDGLNDDIGQYCWAGVVGGGSEWESHAAVRTIVKHNKLDSAVGRVQKRHGRMASYFNRMERGLNDRITNTFDFQSQLNAVKLYD